MEGIKSFYWGCQTELAVVCWTFNHK